MDIRPLFSVNSLFCDAQADRHPDAQAARSPHGTRCVYSLRCLHKLSSLLTLLLLVFFSILSGCAKPVLVAVDALAEPAHDTLRQCIIVPLDPTVSPDDLSFRWYAAHTAQVLREHGYTVLDIPYGPPTTLYKTVKTETVTPETVATNTDHRPLAQMTDADCVVLLAFSISGPHTEHKVRQPSLWAERRNSPFLGRSVANRFSGPYGEITSSHYYAGTLELVARELLAYQLLHKSPALAPVFTLGRQVWKLSAILSGPQNDPRGMFPLILAGIRPYIGRDTGGLVHVELDTSTLGPIGP